MIKYHTHFKKSTLSAKISDILFKKNIFFPAPELQRVLPHSGKSNGNW